MSEIAVDPLPSGVDLTDCAESILRDFQHKLLELRSALRSEPALWEECRRLTREVIADCARGIPREQSVPDRDVSSSAVAPGAACAQRDVHPEQPVRAGAELLDAVVHVLQGLFGERPDPLREVSSDGRRLAREIHDWVGNNVSLAIRQLDLHDIYREVGRPDADSKLADARDVLTELLHGTRRLVSDLRLRQPVAGLADALRGYLRSVDAEGISVDLQVNGDETLLPAYHRDEVFLVIRESLRNIIAHARAERVLVGVDIDADRLRAVIEDDGIGFDLGAADSIAEDSNGLASMRERTELLGGRFVLSSMPGHGTRLEIWIPLVEREHVNDA